MNKKERFFNKQINLIVRKEHIEMANKLIEENPDTYTSRNHVFRCAISYFFDKKKNE